MIIYLDKDIAKIKRGVVAHGVNCQGVMGSGVALALRSAYPRIFNTYKTQCDYSKSTALGTAGLLGTVDIVEANDDEFGDELIIVNCFTQNYYGRDNKRYADINAISTSLSQAVKLAVGLGLPFYMPKIGCGLGGLSWEEEVLPLVDMLSANHNININVCTF